jgi:hypothetical protein
MNQMHLSNQSLLTHPISKIKKLTKQASKELNSQIESTYNNLGSFINSKYQVASTFVLSICEVNPAIP